MSRPFCARRRRCPRPPRCVPPPPPLFATALTCMGCYTLPQCACTWRAPPPPYRKAGSLEEGGGGRAGAGGLCGPRRVITVSIKHAIRRSRYHGLMVLVQLPAAVSRPPRLHSRPPPCCVLPVSPGAEQSRPLHPATSLRAAPALSRGGSTVQTGDVRVLPSDCDGNWALSAPTSPSSPSPPPSSLCQPCSPCRPALPSLRLPTTEKC